MTYKTRKNKSGARRSKNKRLGKRRTFRKKIGGDDGDEWINENKWTKVYEPKEEDGQINDNGYNAFIEKINQIIEIRDDEYNKKPLGKEGEYNGTFYIKLNDSNEFQLLSVNRAVETIGQYPWHIYYSNYEYTINKPYIQFYIENYDREQRNGKKTQNFDFLNKIKTFINYNDDTKKIGYLKQTYNRDVYVHNSSLNIGILYLYKPSTFKSLKDKSTRGIAATEFYNNLYISNKLPASSIPLHELLGNRK
jgi:hypothetical protein